ncbi:MAG: phosphatidate cytidylyltransferase, partial [Eubacteriales bacterium]|nr:phosphatidate cytidylyltransferase [Eubacteriales bacterium]
YLGFIIATVYLLVLDTPLFAISDLIFGVFLLLSLIFMVINHKKVSIYDVALTFFGVCYIPLMFSTVYLIRAFDNGHITVWIPLICAWACDTGAYFTGVAIGKHKLTPELSPKKTIEGAIGGVLFSVIFCGIYGFIMSKESLYIGNLFDNKIAIVVSFSIIGFIGSIFAQFGDLTASSIKRRFNIKDYGKLIPGHGGILDRFDSIIFTAGASYIMLKIIQIYQFL